MLEKIQDIDNKIKRLEKERDEIYLNVNVEDQVNEIVNYFTEIETQIKDYEFKVLKGGCYGQ